jgi:hypothetical protein
MGRSTVRTERRLLAKDGVRMDESQIPWILRYARIPGVYYRVPAIIATEGMVETLRSGKEGAKLHWHWIGNPMGTEWQGVNSPGTV